MLALTLSLSVAAILTAGATTTRSLWAFDIADISLTMEEVERDLIEGFERGEA